MVELIPYSCFVEPLLKDLCCESCHRAGLQVQTLPRKCSEGVFNMLVLGIFKCIIKVGGLGVAISDKVIYEVGSFSEKLIFQ